MKKERSRVNNSSAKNTSVPKTVEEYLAGVPEPARSTLNKVRATIRSVVPAETTEAISYRIPAFRIEKPRYKGMLVWYAAFSDHCSLFPTASVISAFKKDLKDFRVSKGTIHFPVDKPLPAALLKRMVKARIAEMESKALIVLNQLKLPNVIGLSSEILHCINCADRLRFADLSALLRRLARPNCTPGD